jgi:hypothetical protein
VESSGAGWPSTDDVKRRLGITRDDEGLESDIESALGAAIEVVTADCTDSAGDLSFDEDLLPFRLREAALLLTTAIYKAPDAPFGVAGIFDTAAIYVAKEHPAYGNLMRGYRRDFGIG